MVSELETNMPASSPEEVRRLLDREFYVELDINEQKSPTDSPSPVKQSTYDYRQRNPPEDEAEPTWLQKMLSWRYTVSLLINFSWITYSFMKGAMPMAIVCMTAPVSQQSTSTTTNPQLANYSALDSLLHLASGDFDQYIGSPTRPGTPCATVAPGDGKEYEFTWSTQTQGLILSSVNILAFASPLLASWLQTMMSNKCLLTAAWFILGVLMVLSPLAARTDPYCLVSVLIVMGLLLGFNVPVSASTVAWWAPQREKLMMTGMQNAGASIGEVLVPVITGFLCTIQVDNGWPFIFYLFGGLTLLYCGAWFTLSAERPEDHPFISDKEKDYIMSRRSDMGESKLREKPPIRTIMTSVPVVAYMVTGSCQQWAKVVITTSLPLFLTDALEFSIADVGMLVSVITALKMLGVLMWVIICNQLEARINPWRAKKICVVTGLTLGGLFMILSSFLGSPSTRWYFFSLFLPAMISQGSGSTTLATVPLDMAPRYAAVISSILASLGGVIAISGPLIIAAIVKTGSQTEWQSAWCLIGGIHLFSGLIFLTLGDAQMQPWARASSSIASSKTIEDPEEGAAQDARICYGGVNNNLELYNDHGSHSGSGSGSRKARNRKSYMDLSPTEETKDILCHQVRASQDDRIRGDL